MVIRNWIWSKWWSLRLSNLSRNVHWCRFAHKNRYTLSIGVRHSFLHSFDTDFMPLVNAVVVTGNVVSRIGSESWANYAFYDIYTNEISFDISASLVFRIVVDVADAVVCCFLFNVAVVIVFGTQAQADSWALILHTIFLIPNPFYMSFCTKMSNTMYL